MQTPSSLLKELNSSAASFPVTPIRVDLNAYLLPEVHSGSISLLESLQMARSLVSLGINKVIATPLIPPGTYENVETSLTKLISALRENRIALQVELAAKYLINNDLINHISSEKGLHTFGSKGCKPYLLMKTEEIEEPQILEEIIFLLNKRNLIPLLAHPEHYPYLQHNFERAIDLFRLGARFQVNWSSLHSANHKASQQLAEKLIDYRMVSFLGTNAHSEEQIPSLIEVSRQAYFELLIETGLSNNKLA